MSGSLLTESFSAQRLPAGGEGEGEVLAPLAVAVTGLGVAAEVAPPDAGKGPARQHKTLVGLLPLQFAAQAARSVTPCNEAPCAIDMFMAGQSQAAD